jgi:hypothetical protein
MLLTMIGKSGARVLEYSNTLVISTAVPDCEHSSTRVLECSNKLTVTIDTLLILSIYNCVVAQSGEDLVDRVVRVERTERI